MTVPTTPVFNQSQFPVMWIYDATLYSSAGGYRPAETTDFSGGGGGGGGGAYSTPTPMTVGTTYTAGSAIQIICTVAGNVSLEMAGVANVVPVNMGLTVLPYAVTAVNSSGTTATATYASLS